MSIPQPPIVTPPAVNIYLPYMKNTILRNAIVTLTSFVLVITAVHSWTGPSTNPPNDNVDAPITIGEDQLKAGALQVAALRALGGIQVGNTTAECDATFAGTIRYSGTDIEGCVSGVWKSLTLNESVAGNEPIFDLVNGQHTSTQCTDMGGIVMFDGADKFCKFNGACKIGWTNFKNWTQTARNDCNSGSCGWGAGGNTTCFTGSHSSLQNIAIEQCTYYNNNFTGGDSCDLGQTLICFANVIYTGCY